MRGVDLKMIGAITSKGVVETWLAKQVVWVHSNT